MYEEIIKDNIEYNILLQDMKFDHDRLNEIVDIILETVCTSRKKIRIAAMIVCIFSCNVVKCHSSFHRIFVCYDALVGVYAVRQTAYAICRV